MDAWSDDQAAAWRRAQDEYLALTRRDNLVDHYVRPYVTAHRNDFPTTIEEL